MSKDVDLSPALAAKYLEQDGIALNKRQLDMLLYYISGDSKSVACEKAGYRPTASWTLFHAPKVQAALAAIIERFLLVDAAPAALRALYQIINDDKAAPGVRVQAANSILDRAGFNAKRFDKAGDGNKDPSSMSAGELHAEIDRVQAEIDRRAVDVTPDSEPLSSQDLDMYA